jgi:hypothetical protein
MNKSIPMNNPLVRKVVKGLMKRAGMGGLGFHNIYDFTCGNYIMQGDSKVFVPIWRETIHNLVVDESLDDVLGVYFKSGTQSANWYIALFGSDSTPAGAWTYAVPVCTEFTNYDEATREVWTTAAVSSQSLDNSASPAEFTCTSGTNTIYGAMLNNTNTKGDVASGTGVLYSAARFGASRPFNTAEVLKIVITINSQDV